MRNKQGEFVWYELSTADIHAAKAFCSKVVGLHIVDRGMMQLDDDIKAGVLYPSAGDTSVWMMLMPGELSGQF